MSPHFVEKATHSVPLLDLKVQFETIREEVWKALTRVIESQRFIQGPEVEAFENEVARYCGSRFAVGVSSGTDALIVALMAIGIEPGDEVLTTPYTFFATAGSIARLGAKPVFVDIRPDSFNMDAARIESQIGPHTKAILPVHLFGRVADMEPIVEMAHRHGVYVIEDAAQAIGADRDGTKAGTVGHLGCFSFFPSKNLGAFGDAGLVTTDDEDLADRLRMLRNHGHRRKYFNQIVGGNFRLDALQAAVLRVKLPHLDGWTAARRRNAVLYRRFLDDAGLSIQLGELDKTPGYVLPDQPAGYRHIFNQFVIRCSRRDELREWLAQRGIGSEIYYPLGLHLQECFKDLGYEEGDFPHTERATEETLALPIYPELSEQAIRYVADALIEFARSSIYG